MRIHARGSHRGHHGGYLLLELITVVALLAVFSLIIGATFSATYRAQVDAERRGERDHRVDAAMGLLRRDIWNARTIAGTQKGITLTDTVGGIVMWTWGSPWTRTMEGREAGTTSPTMQFAGLPTEDMEAEVHGAAVLLHFGGKASPRESIAFVSQVSSGGTP